MEFGEHIQLSEEEQAALKFGSQETESDWPASEAAFLDLESLIMNRIVDKRSVLDSMRETNTLHRSPAEMFRLRRHIGVLYEAHEQLFNYAVEQGFNLSAPGDH
jgi:hypothetical protein